MLVLTFAIKLKDANYKSPWNILVFCDQWKMMSDLNMSKGKISNFVSFPLLGFTAVIKPRIFDYESHWNTWIFFDKKDMSVLNMPHGKMSDFVSFLLFRCTWVTKPRNFDFESHWNTLIFLWYSVKLEYAPWEDVWFCFISIIWVQFSHKTEKFRFWKSLRYFNIMRWKNDVRFDYVLSNNVWFGLSYKF